MAGFKDFVNGAVVDEIDMDEYLMRQTVMRFASVAARDTALTAGIVADGMQVWTAADLTMWLRTGGAWIPLTPRIATGNVATAAVATFQTFAVTFPVGRFTTAPTLTLVSRTSADVVTQLGVSAETASGFNLHFKRATAVATTVGWTAVQGV